MVQVKDWLLLSAILLTACGGGGGGSDTPQPQTEQPTPDVDNAAPAAEDVTRTLTIEAPSTILSGQAIALRGQVDNEPSFLWRYQWQQVSGPALNIANPTSPLAAFEVPEQGSYQLKLTTTNASGLTLEQFVDFSTTGISDGLNVVRDLSVNSGNRGSLRVQSFSNDGGANWEVPNQIQWQQVEGPSIAYTVTDEQPELLSFNAPTITEDTLVRFRVTASINGENVSDDVDVLLTAISTTPDDYLLEPVATSLQKPGFARVKAYRSDSPWRAALERCVYSQAQPEACALDDLPVIGQQTPNPTIDDILNRVVVSHPWMGEQFEQFLRQRDSNGDFLHLLKATTAIVISSDIRPSFYWAVTGAMYLDPENLWQEPWQRDTINEAPDYRSSFGSKLQFLMPWRYVKNDAYASYYYPRYARYSRAWSDVEPELASLLYHELAHANDFFRPSVQASLSGATLLHALNNLDQIVSEDLTDAYPLTSDEMASLAQVSFKGGEASNTHSGYQPEDVTSFFQPDRATDYYAYSSTREDLAMMFEEAMMQYRYGIQRDVAITNRPTLISADTLVVDWGERGRVAEPHILPRLELVLSAVMPMLNVTEVTDALSTPKEMLKGNTWAESLNMSDPFATPLKARPTSFVGAARQGRWHASSRHTLLVQ